MSWFARQRVWAAESSPRPCPLGTGVGGSAHLETASLRLWSFGLDFAQLRAETYDRGTRVPSVVRTSQERVHGLVPDVHAFPGHIACSSTTKSEVVVPVLWGDRVLAVLDVDSNLPDAFTEAEDKRWLEIICAKLGERDWETGLEVS